jgi:hypothetical protein
MRHKQFSPANPTKSAQSHSTALVLVVILFLGLGLTGLQAQEVIPATGGKAFGSGGTASYSIGQVFYHTYPGTNGSVAEGAQQPHEISIVTAIEGAEGIYLSASAYPNPAANYLTLKISDDVKINHDMSQIAYQLFDMHGNLLQSERITDIETNIDLSNRMSSTYLLQVTFGTKGVKTFKVVRR